MPTPTAGDEYTRERIFTVEEVHQFGALSGDTQPRHVEPDGDGRVMVQGLLTATLPTAIGSDLEVLARSMEFDFHHPVYTGEAITCTWTTEAVDERDEFSLLEVAVECSDESDTTVLTGRIEGRVARD